MNDRELQSMVSSCWKKRRYPTEQTALEAINKVHKKRNTELRVYFCNKCLGYHLTHKILRRYNNDQNKIRETDSCAVAK